MKSVVTVKSTNCAPHVPPFFFRFNFLGLIALSLSATQQCEREETFTVSILQMRQQRLWTLPTTGGAFGHHTTPVGGAEESASGKREKALKNRCLKEVDVSHLLKDGTVCDSPAV